MSGRLSGKVCVITGTGGSVGRAAALAFAREGGSVVGCDVNVAAAEATLEMVRARGGRMISLQPCHLTEPSECRALVDLAVREFERIDVLFNNAALAYFNWLERHHRRGVAPRSAGGNRPGFLPDPRGVAVSKGQPRRRCEHSVAERLDDLQDAGLTGSYDGKGRNHRDDSAARNGRAEARNSREFPLPRIN
jgi:NAD(P)-dependent dehydrogenase (short-subunit alcohol dehydrogenase family)